MRRELNDIEYFNWCVGQPYNLVVAVRVRGHLQPDRLRRALDWAQHRHPLLGVNTEPGAGHVPWFSSAGVGPIPLTVVEGAADDEDLRLAERELGARFDMDRAGPARPPLMRVSLLRGRDPARASLVFGAQHLIVDGLSMVFLVRDLLRFMESATPSHEILDAPARTDDLLPIRVRARMPRSARLFRVVLALTRLYVRLRFRRTPAARTPVPHHRSWKLTSDETAGLRARCRREGVSVQAALCTAFIPAFRTIHTPVNLRPLLARPVGESVGLFVGSADVWMKCRPGRGFWANARRFHRRLQRRLRNPFAVFRLFSKAVPPQAIRELGPLLMAIASRQRPFAITNLGELDRDGARFDGDELRIESFFGAVSGIVDSSVLTVYTIRGQMHLHLLATEAAPGQTGIRDDAARAVAHLLDAIDE